MSTSTARDAPGDTPPTHRGAGRRRGGPQRRSRASGGRTSGSRSAAPTGPVTLTGRGGIVVVFGTAVLCGLLSRWLDMPLLAGAGFTVGCVLAALATRPADLLALAVSPPLVFFLATLVAVLVTTVGQGSLLRGVAVGVLTALAGTAPWLFLGTLLVLLITLPRGLPTNVRELRDKLAGVRLFEEEENENPVRWDESPSSPAARAPRHGDAD
ncbi:DUF6542 domain-containing protein [Actinomadura rifamycini]|uniref:DUF6542 domain-containing protein n=1 Tax=Actinomadura rifamycini TaxID=31962 RepID=UPI0004133B65|nr:DUF6542 domain-containing protein [Actinomadura rifamycini]